MFDALYISATGMRGQQLQIDSIAQNVANLQTVGYRRNVVSFAEVAASLASSTQANSVQSASGMPNVVPTVGAGALPTVTLGTAAGQLTQTNDRLNVAIDGSGYLEVVRPDGSLGYTRAGQLTINTDGMLATSDGSVLSAHVQVPSDTQVLSIDPNGTVSAVVSNSGSPIELGRIELAKFANDAALQPIGDNMYTATAQSGEVQSVVPGDAGTGLLKQGFLEGSNVQMTDEMVTLMLAQRAFELNSKVVQAADQMLSITNSLYR